MAIGFYTAKNQDRKFETNIPRKGIAGPQSQFPHSCVCERLIYSHDGSAYSAAGRKYVDRSWKYINRSQAHEYGNWDWGEAAQFQENEYINGFFVALYIWIQKHPKKQFLTLQKRRGGEGWFCVKIQQISTYSLNFSILAKVKKDKQATFFYYFVAKAALHQWLWYIFEANWCDSSLEVHFCREDLSAVFTAGGAQRSGWPAENWTGDGIHESIISLRCQGIILSSKWYSWTNLSFLYWLIVIYRFLKP